MTSIIIINYNTFQLTCECIRSVISRTTIDYEIILVDNASIERNPNDFLQVFPNINLIISDTNVGFSKGNNLGIAKAIGDHILLLNSDTKLLNNAIDLAYERITQDSNIGALTSQLVSLDGTLQQASNRLMPMYKIIASTFKLHKIFPLFIEKMPNLNSEHFPESIWGTFFLFPRKILLFFPNGKLTETFFMYGEDAEWSYYIRHNGFKLLYYPKARTLHYGGASGKITTQDQWMNGIINQYHLLNIMHGKLYTSCYFLSKSLFYISCFNKNLLFNAKQCFNLAFKGLFKDQFDYSFYKRKSK